MPPQESQETGPWQNYAPQPWLDDATRQAALAKAARASGTTAPAAPATTATGPWQNYAPQPWLDTGQKPGGQTAPTGPPPADVVDPETQKYYGVHAPVTWGEYAWAGGRELVANAPMILGAALPMAAYALAPATGGLSLLGAAALGGIGGRLLQYDLGSQKMPEDTTRTLVDLGTQGAIQGGYQALGEYGLPLAARAIDWAVAGPVVRGVTRVAGPQAGAGVATALGLPSLASKSPAPVGTTIMGRTIPESLSQTMKPGPLKSLVQQAEHYLGRTFTGTSLQDLAARQQTVTREIVADQANQITGGKIFTNPNELSQNFDRAAAYLQGVEQPLRQQIATMPAPGSGQAAQEILNNAEQLGLDKTAKNALQAATGQTITAKPSQALLDALKSMYGKAITPEEAIKIYGEATLQRILPKGITLPTSKTIPATMTEAMAARDALGRIVGDKTTGPAYSALQQMNRMIDSDLGSTGQAAVGQADALSRQQTISRKISANLKPMYLASDPNATPQIAADAFGKMVNDLRNPTYVPTRSGSITTQPSQLEQLYPGNSPQAQQVRKAWVDLSSWLKRAGATQAGRAGLGEGFARIGTMFMAGRVATDLLTGDVQGAIARAAPLVGMSILSHALANPAGVEAVLKYFEVQGAGPFVTRMGEPVAGPLAARIIAIATGIDPLKSGVPAPSPMPTPEDFRPLTLPAHVSTIPPQVGTAPPLQQLPNAREYYEKKGTTQRPQ